MSLFVCFHFLFLLLSVSSVRRLWFNFIAVQMRSPCRVSAGFAIFKFFVGGAFRLSHGTMIIERVAAAETRQAASLRQGFSVASCFHGLLLICRVRHRFRATFSRQPRQVRKEATVTGSFVCSGAPVPGFCLPAWRVCRWSDGRLARPTVSRPGEDARLSAGEVLLSRVLDYDQASLLR